MNSGSKPVVVVGAGIVGLAHAWMAAKAGHDVVVLERSSRAEGASVRNFGMYWPVGQPLGECHDIALRSGHYWNELAAEAQVWVNPYGSIHLAHHEDEWRVLQEFYDLTRLAGVGYELLSPEAVHQRTPAANPERLLGGLWSPTEACVNPRHASAQTAAYLARRYGVRFEWNTAAVHIDEAEIRTGDQRKFPYSTAMVCAGADFETLFPDAFTRAPLKRCKLQMLRTAPQPNGWKLGTHIASGLTLRHYKNFEICPSLAAVKERVRVESPELDQFGIHVMASQNDAGHVILGDSHEYGDAIQPFDQTRIDDLILRELRLILRLPDWTIDQRWHGVYAKHYELPAFTAQPLPNVHVFTGTGGAGMTMSFGLAENFWRQTMGREFVR